MRRLRIINLALFCCRCSFPARASCRNCPVRCASGNASFCGKRSHKTLGRGGHGRGAGDGGLLGGLADLLSGGRGDGLLSRLDLIGRLGLLSSLLNLGSLSGLGALDSLLISLVGSLALALSNI